MQIVVPNFEEIFPEEKKETALFYLLKIPKELLLKSVGFLNTYPLPNYYNFFSKRNLTKLMFNALKTCCQCKKLIKINFLFLFILIH